MSVIFLGLMDGIWVVDALAINVTNRRNFATRTLLNRRSIVKAQKLAFALCDRLDKYFEPLCFKRFHSQGLN